MTFSEITVRTHQLGGVPCIRDLPIPVATVVGMVAYRMSEPEILERFPGLDADEIRATPATPPKWSASASCSSRLLVEAPIDDAPSPVVAESGRGQPGRTGPTCASTRRARVSQVSLNRLRGVPLESDGYSFFYRVASAM